MSTNQQQLRYIMITKRLHQKDIAKLLKVKPETVKSWLTKPTSKAARAMPDHRIETIRHKLRIKKQ